MPIARLGSVALHFIALDAMRSGEAGSTVVMVHGLGAHLGSWYWSVAPSLATAHRVVIFDLRGHGLSSMPRTGYAVEAMATDLEALLDFLGIEHVHLLGHSFGGRVVVQFAHRNPGRVRSMMLVDARLKSVQHKVAIVGWPSSLLRAMALLETDRPNGEIDEPAVALLEALARLRLNARRPPGASSMLKNSPFWGRTGHRAAAQWLRLLEQTTARDDLHHTSDPAAEQLVKLNKPTLLVYGEYSHALPTASALRQIWPHARTAIVHGAGHFFPVENPAHLCAAVHNFFATQN